MDPKTLFEGSLGGVLILIISQASQYLAKRRRGSAEVEVARIKDRGDLRGELWDRIERLETALKDCQDKHAELLESLSAHKLKSLELAAESAHTIAENAKITSELAVEYAKLQNKVRVLEQASVGLKLDDKGLKLEDKEKP